MGKKKLKIIGAEPEDKKVKSGAKKTGRLTDMASSAMAETEIAQTKLAEEEKKLGENISRQTKEELKATKAKKIKPRSKKYKALKAKVDRNKFYLLSEAVDLLLSIAKSKSDQTVELHISTSKDKLTGMVNLPYETGKKQKIVIADEMLIDSISKGKIDFDILITTPSLMPKIAKIAKILGPKGLMPNPKNGTITNEPEKLKKRLEAGELRYKTEAKAPLIHLSIAKISLGKDKIMANLLALVKSIGPANISKATLKATQTPGIKLDLTKIKESV